MEGWNWGVPVWYTCGHLGLIERPTLEIANTVAAYAETVVCWPCWLERKKNAEALRKVR